LYYCNPGGSQRKGRKGQFSVLKGSKALEFLCQLGHDLAQLPSPIASAQRSLAGDRRGAQPIVARGLLSPPRLRHIELERQGQMRTREMVIGTPLNAIGSAGQTWPPPLQTPRSEIKDMVKCRRKKEDKMKWVTRSHVHVDRVACPWLITRFIDNEAEFLFVPKPVFRTLRIEYPSVRCRLE